MYVSMYVYNETVNCEVPHVSSLGAILILLYRNNLANICKVIPQLLFADDTELFDSGNDSQRLSQSLNE